MAYRAGVRGAAECGPVTPMVPGPGLELRPVRLDPRPTDVAALRRRFRIPPSRGDHGTHGTIVALLLGALGYCSLEGPDGVAEPDEGDVRAERVAAGGVAGDAEEDGGGAVRDEGGEPAVLGLDKAEEALACEDGDATAVDGEAEREPGRGARGAECAEGGLERRRPDELGREGERDAVAARLLVTGLGVRTGESGRTGRARRAERARAPSAFSAAYCSGSPRSVAKASQRRASVARRARAQRPGEGLREQGGHRNGGLGA